MSGVNVHASCLVLGDAGKKFGATADIGVLLLGESGYGKSDLLLRMIHCGSNLVADDRTELSVEDGKLFARAPASLAGLMEVRGLGIVALPFVAQAHVVLAVQLVEPDQVLRLPEASIYQLPSGLSPAESSIPLIRLYAFESSATAKIGLAAAAFGRRLFREARNL